MVSVVTMSSRGRKEFNTHDASCLRWRIQRSNGAHTLDVRTYIYVCMYVCMYVRTDVQTYIRTYIHIWCYWRDLLFHKTNLSFGQSSFSTSLKTGVIKSILKKPPCLVHFQKYLKSLLRSSLDHILLTHPSSLHVSQPIDHFIPLKRPCSKFQMT